jgi:predicted DNA-binding transcriptional regulator AlpA
MKINKKNPSQFLAADQQKFFENRIWRIDDVASYTGYSLGTLYNLTSQNLIPYRKKRGRIFFVPIEIQNWIEEDAK